MRFEGREKHDVFPAAPRDGFMAAREAHTYQAPSESGTYHAITVSLGHLCPAMRCGVDGDTRQLRDVELTNRENILATHRAHLICR
jgi:hypothetical protein